MSNVYRFFPAFCAGISFYSSSVAQNVQLVTPAQTTRGDFMFTVDPAPDPAMRHNRLLMERTDGGVYQQIGTFKVKGNAYLYGGRNSGDMFSKEAKAYNIKLNYNTYNQELGFYSTSNPTQALIREPGELDSFIIHADPLPGINQPVKFVYGELTGSKEKAYFQEIYTGTKYSIYKKYRSELGYVSANYIQSDLRQFDMLLEYYYTDAQKKMKKIKANESQVIKEFKNVKDLSGIVNPDDFAVAPDDTFKKLFEYLNK